MSYLHRWNLQPRVKEDPSRLTEVYSVQAGRHPVEGVGRVEILRYRIVSESFPHQIGDRIE